MQWSRYTYIQLSVYQSAFYDVQLKCNDKSFGDNINHTWTLYNLLASPNIDNVDCYTMLFFFLLKIHFKLWLVKLLYVYTCNL